jgi:diguanylate cyclase (GGDEF)-like protein/PAS domain S-box-containing protein
MLHEPDGRWATEMIGERIAARAAQDKFRVIIDALPAIFGYWDARLLNRMANQAHALWFGYTPEQMYGLHLRDVLGAAMFDRDWHRIERALGGEAQTFESSIVISDGTRHHMVVSYVPDAVDDEVFGFFVLVTDITERKRAEEALADEKERIATILDSVSEAVVTLDRSLAVTHLNAAAVGLTGLTQDQARQLPLESVLPLTSELGHPSLSQLCLEVEITGEPISVEVTDVLVAPGRPAVPVDYRITPVRTAGGELSGVVVTLQDVTDSRALLLRTQENAQHDALTGLWNRNYLRERSSAALTDGPTSVLFVDLDDFKEINDSCGHFAGDAALVEVSAVLAANVRPADEVIRLGGDEFVVLLRGCALRDAGTIAAALVSALSSFCFVWGERSFPLGGSIGVACDPDGDRNLDRLIRQADRACYVAKRAGGGTFALAELEESLEPPVNGAPAVARHR